MLHIDRHKIEQVLGARDWSVAALAKACGISRQSIYAMFGNRSVFNSSFEKILRTLDVGYQVITTEKAPAVELLAEAPQRVRRVVLQLIEFCETHSAALILFGSRARGRETIRADCDFGVYFPKREDDRALRLLKQRCIEMAFPYRIDIVNLNRAPTWFMESIKGQSLLVHGKSEFDAIFARRVA